MTNFKEMEEIKKEKVKQFRQTLEENSLENERDANYIFWAMVDVVTNRYNCLVINEFQLDVDFDVFKRSLEAFNVDEFIYYNQSSIDTRVIINFLENGFEIAGVEEFKKSYFDDKVKWIKKGLLIKKVK